jgi:hypothetical protein
VVNYNFSPKAINKNCKRILTPNIILLRRTRVESFRNEGKGNPLINKGAIYNSNMPCPSAFGGAGLN